MKILGYLVAFLMMLAIGTVAIMAGIVAAASVLCFVAWSLAPLSVFKWWIVLRIAMSVGALFGIFFISSKEGAEAADAFAESFKKSYNK